MNRLLSNWLNATLITLFLTWLALTKFNLPWGF